MGGKKKLVRFEQLATMPNVYQNFNILKPALVNSEGEAVDLRNQWSEGHFQNNNPLVLELACGGGEYTVALAERYPNTNFIGIDIKGARIWKGANIALENMHNNIAFCRIRIEQIAMFFGKEVDEIWITFPDPFYKKERRRLTHPNFLNLYRKILKDGGIVHLKTDDDMLFEFTMEILEQENIDIIYSSDNIYDKPLYNNDLEIKTAYEKMHLKNEKTIKYVKFKL